MKCLITIGLCLVFCCVYAQQRHTAKITIQVKDDAGSPVAGIDVGASTFWRHIPGPEFGSDEDKTVTETTDTNGFATLSIPCFSDWENVSMEVAYGAARGTKSKPGYYEPTGLSSIIRFTNVISGKWQPWNPVLELRVDRILNPIPMYARAVRDRKIPAVGTPAGFDLVVGDWIAPDGKGQVADLIFSFDKKTNGAVQIPHYPGEHQLLDNTLTISLPGEGDGIQSAVGNSGGLRLPREAPTNGYRPELIKRDFETATNVVVWVSETRVVRHSDFSRDANYFFRVRAKADDKGNITNALYGKIYGDLNADFGYGRIGFTYYLNPEPNSRNMEFDPKQNLFKNLSPLEQVIAP